ncbi:MAG: hypothetical protein ACRDPW_05690 [Mycobacteriales bacterium]
MTDIDPTLSRKLAEETEYAEAARDAVLPYRRKSTVGGQSVYGLRLPKDRIEQLRRLAAARGVEPSVLARQWVIDGLDGDTAADKRRDQWEHDWRTTTNRIRELLNERSAS